MDTHTDTTYTAHNYATTICDKGEMRAPTCVCVRRVCVCKELLKPTLWRPVIARAIRMAVSFASAPEEGNKKLLFYFILWGGNAQSRTKRYYY